MEFSGNGWAACTSHPVDKPEDLFEIFLSYSPLVHQGHSSLSEKTFSPPTIPEDAACVNLCCGLHIKGTLILLYEPPGALHVTFVLFPEELKEFSFFKECSVEKTQKGQGKDEEG